MKCQLRCLYLNCKRMCERAQANVTLKFAALENCHTEIIRWKSIPPPQIEYEPFFFTSLKLFYQKIESYFTLLE